MSQPGPPATSPSGALSIVLFGLPGAGKSSLLGALAQSARTQERLLNGRLTDRSHGLDELWKRLYVEHARRTAEEVTPYPVDFEPFASDGGRLAANKSLGAVFIDCDGRVANSLLARKEKLPADSPEGTLAREVVRAHTLVLVVDAAGSAAQMEADFAAFERFLQLLQEDRGDRVEVAGLPVFLVLTKCDLLAAPGDSVGAWMERIEQRKREVSERFRDFATREADNESAPPFGRLDLHLWATAVKRPALTETPAKDREPFGVAELFRQCFQLSAKFRARNEKSGQRLRWLVSGAGGVLAAMLAMMIGLATTNREWPGNELRDRVEEIRSLEESTPAGRLHGTPPELRQRLAHLTALQNDPGFSSLPAVDRDYVHSRSAELEEYIAYYEKVERVPQAADVTAGDKLREITNELKQLAPPHDDWAETSAAKLQADRLAEAEALGRAVTRAREWFDDSADKARDLWALARYQPTIETPAINWRGWYDEAARILHPRRLSPFPADEPIPGRMTKYATALHFDRVVEARVEWERERDKLERVVDVIAALGLVGEIKGRPAVLEIPRPPDFPLERSSSRLAELQAAYPGYPAEFVLKGLPDAIIPEVRQAARTNYEYLLQPGREAVLRQLQPGGSNGEDSPARWAKAGEWLAAGPAELADWRQLAMVLARLNDPSAIDPVTALASFLQKTSFSIDINQFTLLVPFRNSDIKPVAGADLTIYHPATLAEGPAIVCALFGEAERDDARKVTLYKFRPRERQRLTYHPGDALWAALPVRDGRELTWTRSHSTVFQFERLLRPPRLHRTDEPSTEGTLEEGIELNVTPADAIPRVPELMPVVRPAK